MNLYVDNLPLRKSKQKQYFLVHITMKIPLAIVFLLFFINSLSHGVEGRSEKLTSLKDDLDIETQLKILNKPPIRSFKDEDGSLIDCIDIYKQPAFDHPLLKNHTLQMRPSALPKGMKTEGKNIPKAIAPYKKEKYDCPLGTVPFKRIQKQDLIRAKAALDIIRPRPINLTSNPSPDLHYAILTSPLADYSQKFYGAQTTISVYNLTEIVGTRTSDAMLLLGSVVDGPYNSIEYGWTVKPGLYGDSQSRTYSFWTADGKQNTGCYNALCPGYVQVSQKRIMGEVNHPVSVFGKDVYAMELTLFKDSKSGNWWLVENLADKQAEPVGYWPKELFTSMANSPATLVQLGGKVYSPPDLPRKVPMGSGAFVADDFTRTCYAASIQLVNSDNKLYEPKHVDLRVGADTPNTYRGDYLGDVSKHHPGRGYTFLFGGPRIRI